MEPNFSNSGSLSITGGTDNMLYLLHCFAGKSVSLSYYYFTIPPASRQHSVDDGMINECEAVGRVKTGRGIEVLTENPPQFRVFVAVTHTLA
jgi:hypothetical protein